MSLNEISGLEDVAPPSPSKGPLLLRFSALQLAFTKFSLSFSADFALEDARPEVGMGSTMATGGGAVGGSDEDEDDPAPCSLVRATAFASEDSLETQPLEVEGFPSVDGLFASFRWSDLLP